MGNKFTRWRFNEWTKEVYDWNFISIPPCFDRFDLILVIIPPAKPEAYKQKE